MGYIWHLESRKKDTYKMGMVFHSFLKNKKRKKKNNWDKIIKRGRPFAMPKLSVELEVWKVWRKKVGWKIGSLG